MNYRDKLLELILENDDDAALMDWVTAEPLLDQPEILRELKALTEEAALENGDNVNEMVAGFDTLEDRIAEDNLIIESTITNEYFPLDFEKINSKIQCVKVYNQDATITVDLKL